MDYKKKDRLEMGVVVCICDPSTRETEAGGSGVQG